MQDAVWNDVGDILTQEVSDEALEECPRDLATIERLTTLCILYRLFWTFALGLRISEKKFRQRSPGRSSLGGIFARRFGGKAVSVQSPKKMAEGVSPVN